MKEKISVIFLLVTYLGLVSILAYERDWPNVSILLGLLILSLIFRPKNKK